MWQIIYFLGIFTGAWCQFFYGNYGYRSPNVPLPSREIFIPKNRIDKHNHRRYESRNGGSSAAANNYPIEIAVQGHKRYQGTYPNTDRRLWIPSNARIPKFSQMFETKQLPNVFIPPTNTFRRSKDLKLDEWTNQWKSRVEQENTNHLSPGRQNQYNWSPYQHKPDKARELEIFANANRPPPGRQDRYNWPHYHYKPDKNRELEVYVHGLIDRKPTTGTRPPPDLESLIEKLMKEIEEKKIGLTSHKYFDFLSQSTTKRPVSWTSSSIDPIKPIPPNTAPVTTTDIPKTRPKSGTAPLNVGTNIAADMSSTIPTVGSELSNMASTSKVQPSRSTPTSVVHLMSTAETPVEDSTIRIPISTVDTASVTPNNGAKISSTTLTSTLDLSKTTQKPTNDLPSMAAIIKTQIPSTSQSPTQDISNTTPISTMDVSRGISAVASKATVTSTLDSSTRSSTVAENLKSDTIEADLSTQIPISAESRSTLSSIIASTSVQDITPPSIVDPLITNPSSSVDISMTSTVKVDTSSTIVGPSADFFSSATENLGTTDINFKAESSKNSTEDSSIITPLIIMGASSTGAPSTEMDKLSTSATSTID